MITKKLLWAALWLVTAGPLANARNTIPTARLDWFHSAGHLHSLGDGHTGDSWVESVGGVRYQFQEKDRNHEYVEIRDATRGVSERIYKDHLEVKFDTETNFRSAYNGKWDTRRIFYTLTNPNGRPYFLQIQNNQFMYIPPGTNGPLFFDTVERTDDKIIIQGHGRKYWLMDNYVSYQDGPETSAVSLFFEGYWDEINHPNP